LNREELMLKFQYLLLDILLTITNYQAQSPIIVNNEVHTEKADEFLLNLFNDQTSALTYAMDSQTNSDITVFHAVV